MPDNGIEMRVGVQNIPQVGDAVCRIAVKISSAAVVLSACLVPGYFLTMGVSLSLVHLPLAMVLLELGRKAAALVYVCHSAVVFGCCPVEIAVSNKGYTISLVKMCYTVLNSLGVGCRCILMSLSGVVVSVRCRHWERLRCSSGFVKVVILLRDGLRLGMVLPERSSLKGSMYGCCRLERDDGGSARIAVD